jgi:hypothetical protein
MAFKKHKFWLYTLIISVFFLTLVNQFSFRNIKIHKEKSILFQDLNQSYRRAFLNSFKENTVEQNNYILEDSLPGKGLLIQLGNVDRQCISCLDSVFKYLMAYEELINHSIIIGDFANLNHILILQDRYDLHDVPFIDSTKHSHSSGVISFVFFDHKQRRSYYYTHYKDLSMLTNDFFRTCNSRFDNRD